MWKSIAGLWIINVILVCAPFFGFGLWYNENAPGKCARFRDGRDPIDRAYAFLFFTFGKLKLSINYLIHSMTILGFFSKAPKFQ